MKDETYRVAERHGIKVGVVANAPILVPKADWIVRVTVGQGLDVADDWIAARARPGVIVITADIPLAARCIKGGAGVVAPNGKVHTEASIGATLATRNLMDSLRSAGEITGGPAPFAPRDRSAFLSALDLAIRRLQRGSPTR